MQVTPFGSKAFPRICNLGEKAAETSSQSSAELPTTRRFYFTELAVHLCGFDIVFALPYNSGNIQTTQVGVLVLRTGPFVFQ
jgi:hypothetical protein